MQLRERRLAHGGRPAQGPCAGIALRDFGPMLGALTPGRLAPVHDRPLRS